MNNEEFLTWAKEGRWLKISEGGNPQGRQDMYLTPTGELVVAQYNLQGDLLGFIKPMPAPMMMSRGPGLDLRGVPHP